MAYIIHLGSSDGGSYLEVLPNGSWFYGLYRWAKRFDTREEAEEVAEALRRESDGWNPVVEEDVPCLESN